MRRVEQDVGECIFATTSASWCLMPHSPANFNAPFLPRWLSSFPFSLTARSRHLEPLAFPSRFFPLSLLFFNHFRFPFPHFHFSFSTTFIFHFLTFTSPFPSLSFPIHNLFLTCSTYLCVDKSEFLPYCMIKDVYHAKSQSHSRKTPRHSQQSNPMLVPLSPCPLVPLPPCLLPLARARVMRAFTLVIFIFLLSLLSHNNCLLIINSSKNPEKLDINRRSAYPKFDCESTFL